MNELAKVSSGIMYDYKVINTTDNHTWFSDEPLELGGQDEGPKPTELLLSSLASCMLITLRVYAQRRNWNVGEIHVDLVMNQLEEGVEIIKNIEFSGDLEDEQKTKLLAVSDRCPVAKILLNPIHIKHA